MAAGERVMDICDTLPRPTSAGVMAAQGRIAGHAIVTPLLTSPWVNEMAGCEVLVKAECLQVTGSFKIRGAANRMTQLDVEQRRAGVVAFSSGNHAQAVARVAAALGLRAVIVMPSDAPRVKIEGVQRDGAEIVLYDRLTESREEIAAHYARVRGAVLVPSFEDPDIIEGQGTCGLEMVEQAAAWGKTLDHVVCCTGGGGLAAGCALAMEGCSPRTTVWTAEPEGHDDWTRSWSAGERLENAAGVRSTCDALMAAQPGVLAFEVGQRLFAGGCVVSDAQVYAAMRAAFAHFGVVAEPGGAAALAAALFAAPGQWADKTVGVVITGSNVDPLFFARVLAGDDPEV